MQRMRPDDGEPYAPLHRLCPIKDHLPCHRAERPERREAVPPTRHRHRLLPSAPTGAL